MPLLKIDNLAEGLARDWSGFLRDWDRTLRAGNYPETTRYNYLLAAAQLARYLAEHSPTRTPTTPPKTQPRSRRSTSSPSRRG
ncbi:hypothetical protein [Dactylosporangium sp. CA-139066]|uniref:hypothetical protein n=1 Tax=Dactylosporangium sp. CA-139066 TaxID=3239930 RepID=UPI003D8FDD21